MIFRLSLIFLIKLPFFLPLYLQTDPAQLPSCTADQLSEIEQNYEELGLIPVGVEGNIDPQGTTRWLIIGTREEHKLLREVFIATLPNCREAALLAALLALNLDVELSWWTFMGLFEYVTRNGDPAVAEQTFDRWSSSSGIINELLINEPVMAILSNLASQAIIPPCDLSENVGFAGYESLLADYEILYPQFVDFMETGSGDFDALFVSERLATESYIQLADACEEDFALKVQITAMLVHTSLAIHLEQVAFFEARYGDSEVADQLFSLAGEYAASATALHTSFQASGLFNVEQ